MSSDLPYDIKLLTGQIEDIAYQHCDGDTYDAMLSLCKGIRVTVAYHVGIEPDSDDLETSTGEYDE